MNKKIETPVINLYQSFNVLPFPLLHEMQMLMFVHKCYYNLDVPLIFKKYFLENNVVHFHNTRNNNCDLHVKSVHSTIDQRCSLFFGSKLWNALPRSLKTISFPLKFKREKLLTMQRHLAGLLKCMYLLLGFQFTIVIVLAILVTCLVLISVAFSLDLV